MILGLLGLLLSVLGVFHAVGLAVGDDDGGVVQEAKARGFAASRWWKSRNLHVLGHFAVECGASSRTC